MRKYLEGLKKRWEIQSNRQLLIILVVFAITGSGSLKIAQPVLDYAGISAIENPWIRIPLRIVCILPVYQVLLLLTGAVFGQFYFFLNLQKRWFLRRKKIVDHTVSGEDKAEVS
jgi:hypothetical protein